MSFTKILSHEKDAIQGQFFSEVSMYVVYDILSHEKDAIEGQFFSEVSFYVVYETPQSTKGCHTRSVL